MPKNYLRYFHVKKIYTKELRKMKNSKKKDVQKIHKTKLQNQKRDDTLTGEGSSNVFLVLPTWRYVNYFSRNSNAKTVLG